MKSGNLQSASARLQKAFEKLEVAWTQTTDHWSDANARNFEENHLHPLAETLHASLPAIGQLTQTFNAAARECADQDRER